MISDASAAHVLKKIKLLIIDFREKLDE